MRFLKRLGIKVVKTMSQTAIGVITGASLLSEVNWMVVASSVVLSGILCVLMNLSDLKEPEE